MARFIGIQHRRKQTAAGEARPTMVCIMGGRRPVKLELVDEQAELDFVTGKLPVKFRLIQPGEDLSSVSRTTLFTGH